MGEQPKIEAKDMELRYGAYVVMRDVNVQIKRGEIFIIMGGSGSGKSTLLKAMTGLLEPARGAVYFDGVNFTAAPPEQRNEMVRQFGVLFQSGALWSSMTLEENVALPLEQFTRLAPAQIKEIVRLKLALVGLKGFEEYYPSQISGGMAKRAGLARAMALDADILFLDEPSAGLDPISSRRLDELILQLRDSLQTTVVVVTHELASIFAIGDNSIYLSAQAKTVTARGNPRRLLEETTDPEVKEFLSRGAENLGKKEAVL
ncbi:ABC transporter ATP-binding protein [Pedosphaera parvula]|uniref:ABC transporter related-protein n=1 Tax=Pedosphaera parvula (strain Ellin514) TaxID=320771 RepID=B9XGL7_PEDPL|nr:ATP-binding cassette domain-containing protein [Pedosphaera parvula]EEF61068.1 ABC transporter related-protein [Pedosphaera parvula Ellin514]